jgi:hypothetical protein
VSELVLGLVRPSKGLDGKEVETQRAYHCANSDRPRKRSNPCQEARSIGVYTLDLRQFQAGIPRRNSVRPKSALSSPTHRGPRVPRPCLVVFARQGGDFDFWTLGKDIKFPTRSQKSRDKGGATLHSDNLQISTLLMFTRHRHNVPRRSSVGTCRGV